MQLSPELEDEIRQVMNTYWSSYLVGDIDTWASFITDEYHNIGTTEEEIWRSKQEIMDYTMAAIDQLKGGADLRNKTFQFMNYGPFIMVHELADMYLRMEEEWVFYAKLRMSSLLEKRKDGWKILHQHGSYPDANAGQGDILGFEKIKHENSELREAVRRRTIDLEIKNRELEIEAALERVRTVAMGMKVPGDMPGICRIISQELEQFGVKGIRNLQTVIIQEDRGEYLCYQYFVRYRQEATEVTKYHKNPVEQALVDRMLAAKDNYFEGSLKGEALDTFRQHRKNEKYLPDPELDLCEEAFYYFYSIGKGALGITLYKDLDDQGLQLFKRFHQVFSLAYQRFRDIEQAEAQAREAQIEAALERVRSRSMAMHKSTELNEVAFVLFEQVRSLGGHLWGTGFALCNAQNGMDEFWFANEMGVMPPVCIPNTIDEVHKAMLLGWQQKKDYFVAEKGGDELAAHYKGLYALPQMKAFFDPMIAAGFAFPTWQQWHAAYFSKGYLLIITTEPYPDPNVFRRFAKVFDQAYTRFLDLQRAEAQAREAQIEVALERVRARAMAMHSSRDLSEVVGELRRQMGLLGQQNLETCVIHLHDESPDFIQSYAAIKPPESSGDILETTAIVPKKGLKIIEEALAAYDRHQHDYVIVNEGEKLMQWFSFLEKESPQGFHKLVGPVQGKVGELRAYWSLSDFTGGSLVMVTMEPPEDLSRGLLRRFANVFGLAYRRYADLKKAEAQARESQIEASLERIRSRTMGMQRSEELREVIQVVFEQLVHLGIHTEHAGFVMDYRERGDFHTWIADHLGSPSNVTIPYFDCTYYNRFNEAKAKQLDFFSLTLDREGKNSFYEGLFPLIPQFPEESKQVIFDYPGFSISTVLLENVALYIENFTGVPYDEESNTILMRVGKVFQQTYTRFLDLQKAEAQAREAQIEAALERVRARAMAMHKSEEILDVCESIGKQLVLLDFDFQVINIGTNIGNKERDLFLWIYSKESGKIYPGIIKVPYIDNPIFNRLGEALLNKEEGFVLSLDEHDKRQYYNHLFEHTDVGKFIPSERRAFLMDEAVYAASFCVMKQTLICVVNYHGQLYTESQNAILIRIGKVFEQTYTRFLDLQKAEAQAREAQIEAALERVRSKTMAMHNSADVGETAAVMVEELRKLGIDTLRCGIGIMHEPGEMEVWTIQTEQEGKSGIIIGTLDMHMHPLLHGAFENWRKKGPQFSYILEGDDLVRYYMAINNHPGYPIRYDLSTLPSLIHHNEFHFPEGVLFAFSLHPMPDAHKGIFTRFAGIFGQTYRRYLDLTRAEAQAREAQIEAALERVRSKAMAMRNSEDIAETTAASFDELKILGISSFRSGVGILQTGSRQAQVFADTRSTDGKLTALATWRNMDEHPALQQQYVAWEQQQDYEQVLSGDDLVTYYSHPFFKTSDIVMNANGKGKPEYGYYFAFPDGLFYSWSYQPYTDSEKDILRRFRKIIALTFRRYLDLQKAEAQAREATKQASLDRVRAVIASMRSAADLEMITPLVFKELTILEVPFIRCGVFIINEAQRTVEAYLSSPDGHPLGVLRLPYNASELTFQTVEAWRKGKMYRQHWNKEDFIAWTKAMMEQHQIEDSRTYQGTDTPPESLDLHFVPFAQGMLYVGAVAPLNEDALELVRSLAEAFSIAYARYEDFVKLEKARADMEIALTELKATQKQLIQSEKMASLGELTAGIAHEIQNPLNFVNNFSEVSKELMEEIREAMASGDVEGAREIMEDLVQNLDKINEHGKRADSIVKGMLQHSRAGSGQKEPTDINVLADECLRLAFHGMRAKDKSFNASFDTVFDPGVGKVDIMPQDMGRVLLNLVNNAFYAVLEKGRHGVEGYKPTVKVTTRRIGKDIEIRVEDNGEGIPEAIREKIFQPFFTTKPTGQGTGLGLSLAYDIVKAHGGELTVDSREGEGTNFIIHLPKTS